MHIDVPAAGLLAQVLPTILIFLALEGRGERTKRTSLLAAYVHVFIRTNAILWSLITTFGCLAIVIFDASPDGFLGTLFWFLILMSVLFLFMAVFLMLYAFLTKDINENWLRHFNRDAP